MMILKKANDELKTYSSGPIKCKALCCGHSKDSFLLSQRTNPHDSLPTDTHPSSKDGVQWDFENKGYTNLTDDDHAQVH